MKEEVVYDPATPSRTLLRRISWQAVFAGLIVALALELLLIVLGISIGATVVNPFGQNNAVQGVSIGEGIWFIVVSIISLFIGGWVAGRLSGLGRTTEGALHGLVTWGAATLVTFYLLSTALGGAISGITGLLARLLPGASEAVAPNSYQQGGMGSAMQGTMSGNWDSIRQEAQSMMQRNTPPPTGRTEGQAGQNQSPQLMAALDRLFSQGGNIDPNDRQAVVTILVSQQNMSQEEANRTVERWIQNYQQTRAQIRQNARQAGNMGVEGVSVAGWWSFIVLVLSGLAGIWGGSRGTLAFLRTRIETPAAA